MKHLLFLLVALLLGTDLAAQNCAPTARGNNTGRRFLLNYDSAADRDAAIANISSITIDGTNYNVEAHPTRARRIRTTPTVADGTFANPFTGTVTLSTGEVCSYADNALPITLDFINADFDKRGIVISWKTSQEVNNKGFEIEKSRDGRHFDSYLWVDGAGSTDKSQYYEVIDNSYASKTIYYRLKQVDFDGAFEYSPIVIINVDEQIKTGLKSNLVSKGENLELTSSDSGSYQIFNAAGNVLINDIIGMESQSISTENLNSGIYFLKLSNGEVLKFVVQ